MFKGLHFSSKIEIQTLILILIIYSSWILLTLHFHDIHAWLTLPLAAFITAWHSSLQHETIHGHPTRIEWLNDFLRYLPLGLIYPYPLYKKSHLKHHTTEQLTHPIEDPESYYVTLREWQHLKPLSRCILRIHNTALGRLFIGPAIAIIRFYQMEFIQFKSGNFKHLKTWIVHLLLSIFVLSWVIIICKISFTEYLFFFVYPGMSLILLRSFAEHKPDSNGNMKRSAIVESEMLFRILYLGNNYHYLHHKLPATPWYNLKKIYKAERKSLLYENGHYLFKGY